MQFVPSLCHFYKFKESRTTWRIRRAFANGFRNHPLVFRAVFETTLVLRPVFVTTLVLRQWNENLFRYFYGYF